MEENLSSLEALLFYYLDKLKFLFFPDQWSSVFLDYSKNDVFALLFIYRRNYANMTELADYMNIPLNTATGIISRLEKKEMVKRERNSYDKRVVTISLTSAGREFIKSEIKEIAYYFNKVLVLLTEEEKETVLGIADKVFQVIGGQTPEDNGTEEKKVKRIPIE